MICLVYFSLWLELKECMKSILILFFLTFILTVKKKNDSKCDMANKGSDKII